MNETGLVGDDPCCVMSSLNMSRLYTNFCCCGGTSIFDRGKDLARVKRRNVQFTCAKSSNVETFNLHAQNQKWRWLWRESVMFSS